MADDLARWLEELDLGKYAEILAEHEVSARDLPHLAEDDLKDLALGPGRRLLAAVKSGNEFSISTQPEQRIEEEAAPALQKAPVRNTERRLLTVMFADLVGPPSCPGGWIGKNCGKYSEACNRTAVSLLVTGPAVSESPTARPDRR